MMSKSHISIGIASSAIFISYENIPLTAGVVLGAIGGSLLPDIDTPYSRIGKSFPNISRFLYKKIGHRNFTHSLLCVLTISLLFDILNKITNNLVNEKHLFLLNPNLYHVFFGGFRECFIIGYAAHIFGDMLAGGVYLFWPFYRSRCRLLSVKVGSLTELLIVIIFSCFAMAYFFLHRNFL